MFSKLLSWMILLAQSQQAKEIEILVLRHQLAILQRRTPRPRMNWADRALTAALARLLPTRRRLGLLVTPATILRWHRRLVARGWTTQPTPPGRPPLPSGLCALAVRLATEKLHVGLPTQPRRTRPPRLPDRRLHCLEDPQECRSRSLAPTNRTQLGRVPASPGARDPGLRLVSSRWSRGRPLPAGVSGVGMGVRCAAVRQAGVQ